MNDKDRELLAGISGIFVVVDLRSLLTRFTLRRMYKGDESSHECNRGIRQSVSLD